MKEASIEKKMRYLEALGRKLYNRKFSLPSLSSTYGGSPEGTSSFIFSYFIDTSSETNEICLELVFQLPSFGSVHYDHLS